MKINDRNTIYIDFSHIMSFDTELADTIVSQYYRFESSLRKTIQSFMFNLSPDHARNKIFDISFFGLPSLEK